MKNLLLKAAVKSDISRRNLIDSMTNRRDAEEHGDIVQTILIIAIFLAIVVAAGFVLSNAIGSQANDVARCIEGAGTPAECS